MGKVLTNFGFPIRLIAARTGETDEQMDGRTETDGRTDGHDRNAAY